MKKTLLLSVLISLSGCPSATDLYDFDGDGSLDSEDCQPTNAEVFPGANDPYGDGVDQNCDGVDGNAVDRDGDGYSNAVDCDDDDPSIYPGAADDVGGTTGIAASGS